MRQPTRVCIMMIIVALSVASELAAQRPQTREGFWIAFGLGYGSADLSCDGCAVDLIGGGRAGGGVAHVRLGGTLSPRVLLGGDVTGWTKDKNGVTLTAGNVSMVVVYYPMVEGGLFVKGGAGFSSIMIEEGGQQTDGASFGLSGGFGYDVRVGRNISITPLFDFLYAGSQDLQYQSQTRYPGVTANMFSVSVGVTFH